MLTRRRLTASGLSIGIAMTLAGCASVFTTSNHQRSWPVFGHDPANTRYVPDQPSVRSKPTVRWRTEIDVASSPIVVDGRIFVTGERGRDDRSETKTEGDDNGSRRAVFAVDFETGEIDWTRPIDVDTAPCTDGRTVVAGTRRGGLVALDVDTGNPHWRVAENHGDQHQLRLYPTVADGTVYAASRYGVVRAHAARDGAKSWQTSLPSEGIDVDLGFVPAVTGDTVVVGAEHVHALNRGDGSERWRFSPRKRLTTSPSVAGSTVFIGDRETLYALALGDGTVRWKTPIVTEVARDDPQAPAVDDRYVYLGGWNGGVHAFDRQTGERAWVGATEFEVFHAVVVTDETVIAGDFSHGLYGFDKTGTRLWDQPAVIPRMGRMGPFVVVDGAILLANGGLQKIA